MACVAASRASSEQHSNQDVRFHATGCLLAVAEAADLLLLAVCSLEDRHDRSAKHPSHLLAHILRDSRNNTALFIQVYASQKAIEAA